MTLYNSMDDLHRSLASAQYVDMSEVTDNRRLVSSKPYTGDRSDIVAYKEWQKTAYEEFKRRPNAYELYVVSMFPQVWGSTALGFGGIGGSAMTSAYTIIIGCDETGEYCVYFGGHFAYKLDMSKCDIDIVSKDIANRNMAEVSQRGRYLKKKVM